MNVETSRICVGRGEELKEISQVFVHALNARLCGLIRCLEDCCCKSVIKD